MLDTDSEAPLDIGNTNEGLIGKLSSKGLQEHDETPGFESQQLHYCG